MNWFRVETANARSQEFLCSTMEQRGKWLTLLNYCAEQNNGGVIEGAAELPSIFFQQSCGMTLEQLREDCPLWSWKEPDLLVGFYPHQAEANYLRLAGQAQDAANKRWGNNGQEMPDGMPDGNADKTDKTDKIEKTDKTDAPPSGGGSGSSVSLDEFVEFGVSKNFTRRFCKDRYEQLENDGWLSGGKPVKSWQRWLVAVGKKQGAFNPSPPKDQPAADYSMEYVEIEMRRREKERRP